MPLDSDDDPITNAAARLSRTAVALWDEKFAALERYRAEWGNCNVPIGWKHDRQLSRWVVAQRQAKRQGVLGASQIARLDALGFEWDPHAASWERKFAALTDYWKQHGSCNVSRLWKDAMKLGEWVASQRRARKRRELSRDRIARLDALGLEWAPVAEGWENMYAALAIYRKQHGNCNVPCGWKDFPELGNWVARQRSTRKQGKVSRDRIARLDALGFEWAPLSTASADRWADRLNDLVAYRARYGNCNVPAGWKENTRLATWVVNQRQLKTRNRLSAEQIEKLDRLGFAWSPMEATWEVMFSELVAYRTQHGDCNVPQCWESNRRLGIWVHSQRAAKKKNRLGTEQIARLNELGFVWHRIEAAWEEMFGALLAYKEQHGDCRVPTPWEANRRLSDWISHQRYLKKRNRLDDRRAARLEAEGFVWDRVEGAWEEMFGTLLAYKEQHGDCRVPTRWEANRRLADWVARQRYLKKRNRLNADRVVRLDAEGFEWRANQHRQQLKPPLEVSGNVVPMQDCELLRARDIHILPVSAELVQEHCRVDSRRRQNRDIVRPGQAGSEADAA